MDASEYESALKNIEKMERAIYKKGRHRWYDETGKLIINGHNDKQTYNDLIKIIKDNKETYIGHRICHVKVQFYTKEEDLLDENLGAMELIVVIYHVDEFKNKISLQTKDESTTIVHLFYYIDDLPEFKLVQIKNLVMLLLDGKIKGDVLKYYHYKELQKKLNN